MRRFLVHRDGVRVLVRLVEKERVLVTLVLQQVEAQAAIFRARALGVDAHGLEEIRLALRYDLNLDYNCDGR